MKRGLSVVIWIWFTMKLFPQAPGVDVSFHQILDNREYYSEYAFPQTIFGARLDAAAVFGIDSVHSFAAGLNYLYEHGSAPGFNPPTVTLYYRYEGEHLEMAFGALPRTGRLDFPLLFLNDTLNYYRPTVEGAYISYGGDWGNIRGFIDWTGRISETTREAFMAGLHGKLTQRGFFIEPVLLMVHQARSYASGNLFPIRDNGALSLSAGYAIQHAATPISISLSAGYLTSYDRVRPGPLTWSNGVISSMDFRYTIFGLKGVYYFGGPVDLVYGDPFYRSGNYGRMDFYVDPFRHDHIDSKIGWNIHLVPGEGIYHSQQLLISIRF